jgi:hypothetical protein
VRIFGIDCYSVHKMNGVYDESQAPFIVFQRVLQ